MTSQRTAKHIPSRTWLLFWNMSVGDNGRGGKAIVGGLLQGGYMKLAFYHVYPERVAALLIIDTGLGFKKNTAREGWNEHANATASQFEKGGLKSLQERSQERSQVSHRNAKGLALAARGMLAQRNAVVINSLPNIKVPSLVVVGGDDTPFLTASSYMANKIPGAQKVVIPNAGHAANIDQAKLFNDSLLLFLKDFQLNKARL